MWFIRFASSSIGKKLIMAATGLLLLLFLVLHALGNAAIFVGSDAFQHYADALHSLPVVVIVFGIGLFAVLLCHIAFGVNLFLDNRNQRTNRYQVTTRVVSDSFASRTMPYTGLGILLFILVHVLAFHDLPPESQVSQFVRDYLSNGFTALFYIAGFCVLGLHLRHGFWSLLQTLGLNHPRYNEAIARLSLIVPVAFFVFFRSIAIYFVSGLGATY